MSPVADIEDAFLAHWSNLGRWSRGRLIERDGLVWFETPIRRLPYNGVISTRLRPDTDADAVIDGLAERFASRGVEWFWIDHPSAGPPDLGRRLEARGLPPLERVTGMALDLADPPAAQVSPDVLVAPVEDEAAGRTYAELTAGYWSVPGGEQELLGMLHAEWSRDPARGRRYLAQVDGRVVGKGYLSFAGPPGVAAIYGMSVLPVARGRGVASALTAALIRDAGLAGARRVVLHSSEMAVGVDRRAGFHECCNLTVHASAQLWPADH